MEPFTISGIEWQAGLLGAIGKKGSITYDIVWSDKANKWKGNRKENGVITHTLYEQFSLGDLMIDMMLIDNPDKSYYIDDTDNRTPVTFRYSCWRVKRNLKRSREGLKKTGRSGE